MEFSTYKTLSLVAVLFFTIISVATVGTVRHQYQWLLHLVVQPSRFFAFTAHIAWQISITCKENDCPKQKGMSEGKQNMTNNIMIIPVSLLGRELEKQEAKKAAIAVQ